MTFYLSTILDLQNFFHIYILQSWKLKRPQIQLRPHHFWTYTSNLSGQLITKIYDKRDDFNFKIINFPNMCSNIPASPSYGVYISQLIRYARASSNYSDFLKRHFHLRNRLLDQGYKKIRLIRSLNPLVPRVAYSLHELLRGTNSKINVCFVFFPSVECLLHCKVIIRYRNIVIIPFCGYLLFSRKCQPP